jgi:hypothetical protein
LTISSLPAHLTLDLQPYPVPGLYLHDAHTLRHYLIAINDTPLETSVRTKHRHLFVPDLDVLWNQYLYKPQPRLQARIYAGLAKFFKSSSPQPATENSDDASRESKKLLLDLTTWAHGWEAGNELRMLRKMVRVKWSHVLNRWLFRDELKWRTRELACCDCGRTEKYFLMDDDVSWVKELCRKKQKAKYQTRGDSRNGSGSSDSSRPSLSSRWSSGSSWGSSSMFGVGGGEGGARKMLELENQYYRLVINTNPGLSNQTYEEEFWPMGKSEEGKRRKEMKMHYGAVLIPGKMWEGARVVKYLREGLRGVAEKEREERAEEARREEVRQEIRRKGKEVVMRLERKGMFGKVLDGHVW